MTKLSTLDKVLSNNHTGSKSRRLPARQSISMIMQYSMALEVIRTENSGIQYLILN
ncbi:MAG: hypothetical protein IPH88_00990 [Bacteroidales bacterium]|nr:hypothetical protein [Bacteroidales bacterium]